MLGILKKLFGDKNERTIKSMQESVAEINRHFASLEALTEEQLIAKTAEFKERLATGNEDVDDLLPEAFAVVKEACRRLVGTSWLVTGRETVWDMVPYDVQLMGGIVLHQGRIAEMATGEGKTLVATLPLYLNALEGKGAQLVTVNDYLAQRDSEWMGGIFKYLGLTVGCILSQMTPQARHENYACDITYGTNNEFGFDYLRDNMATTPEEVVQRGHHYAIVDEVDSVLIDEARTPLIIAGPARGNTDLYNQSKPAVETIVHKQREMVNNFIAEGEKLYKKVDAGDQLSNEEERELGLMLLKASRGMPKHKRLIKLLGESGTKKIMTEVENEFLSEKKMHLLDEELYFSIDEKQHSVDVSEMGRELLAKVERVDKDMYVLPDFADEIHQIKNSKDLSDVQREAEMEKFETSYSAKSERIHNLSQLLRAYTLYEKDIEYVVQEGKVLIVDEHTGRLMVGRRYSDGLHQAIEAKEGVTVEGETQTIATVTLQNYFRLYKKLAGMTGTAVTEEEEFYSIYKLEVTVVPTNKPMIRDDDEDMVYKTKAEKYDAVVDHVADLNKQGLPVLIGTVSVEVSELLSRYLNRKGVKHNVLNAKQHQREAEIVASAGQAGSVTIATNMAGRGTDIKLGEGVVHTDEKGNRVGGLQIIGTERHESRRIDRQLRGRSGRQGDPGRSQFYLSLEDNLMRLFGSERIASVMDRLGVQKGEVITHALITRSIEKAQKRVEQYNFGVRKQLIEYDDVMNQQRETVYTRRRNLLFGGDPYGSLNDMLTSFAESLVDDFTEKGSSPHEWDWDALTNRSMRLLGVDLTLTVEQRDHIMQEELQEIVVERAKERLNRRRERIGEEGFGQFIRWVQLRVIDEKWRDHLANMDRLKEGVGLRAYGQKDPLIEYKREGFELFQQMFTEVEEEVLRIVFRAEIELEQQAAPPPPRTERVQTIHKDSTNLGFTNVAAGGSGFSAPTVASGGGKGNRPQDNDEDEDMESANAPREVLQPIVRSQPKVGRNDLCPCGSGKKYKNCHGAK